MPIHYILEYTGTEYEEKIYNLNESAEWFEKDKKNLPLDFPNLPYLIDGDLKITQSLAILNYIADKHNLSGEGDDKYRVQMLEFQAMDFYQDIRGVAYGFGDYEERKADLLKKLPAKLTTLTAFLKDKEWFAGDKITSADFAMYSYLDILRNFAPEAFENADKINAFFKRFEALPAIEKYKKSDRFVKWPIFGPTAPWGGK